ncbi:hypothetical protein [Streptomyces griseus]|uniref:hypothetical protein n=1 Tax=Streptomyces griseus TaxID=1911 RepID=UPI0033BFFD68
MRQQRITRKKAARRSTGEWETAADAERRDRQERARRQARRATIQAEKFLDFLSECEA